MIRCPRCNTELAPKPFYGVSEVASMIGVSKERVRQLIRAGHLKPRFRLLGGHNYQTLIDSSSFTRFINNYFPQVEDLAFDSPNPRIQRLRKVVERQRAISRKGGLTTAIRRKLHASNAIGQNDTGQTYSMESEDDSPVEEEQMRPESLREPERALGDDRQPLSREEDEKDEDETR